MNARSHLRLGGVPVRIEPGFIVVVLILGIDPYNPSFSRIVSWLVVVTVSILVHEMGHAMAFRARGLAPRISLQGLGGLTSASGELTPIERIGISLAGPICALVLLGFPALWATRNLELTGESHVVISQLLWVNIGWSVLNLLPVLPLDGGQVMLAVADLVTRGHGVRVARVISVVGAAGLGLIAWSRGMTFGVLLAVMFAGVNLTQLSKAKADRLFERLRHAESELQQGRPDKAESIVEEVIAGRPSGAVLRWATELGGWCRLLEGDAPAAVTVAARGSHVANTSAAFEAGVAMVAGERDRGVALAAWAMVNEPPDPRVTLVVMVAGRCGLIPVVAAELLAMESREGMEQASVLAMLSQRCGYAEAGEAVRSLIRSDPRASRPDPP